MSNKKEQEYCSKCGMPFIANRDGVCMYCGAKKTTKGNKNK